MSNIILALKAGACKSPPLVNGSHFIFIKGESNSACILHVGIKPALLKAA